MKNDGYADNTATTDRKFIGDLEFVPSGEHGQAGHWEWSVSEVSYNLETEEEECHGIENGDDYDEVVARREMEAALFDARFDAAMTDWLNSDACPVSDAGRDGFCAGAIIALRLAAELAMPYPLITDANHFIVSQQFLRTLVAMLRDEHHEIERRAITAPTQRGDGR